MEANTFLNALKSGDIESVEKMLDGNPDLVNARTPQGLSAVLLATYYAQPAIADLLIERGASLDLYESAATGRLDSLKACLESDPSLVNAFAPDGFQPLGLAAFFGQEPVVDFLLARGATVNTPSNNPQHVQPLHSAVAGKHLEIARTLLMRGADANACQSGGFTPLHAAAQNGQMGMVQLLLEHGADVQAVSFDGKTAMDLALENGHLQVADLLRDRE